MPGLAAHEVARRPAGAALGAALRHLAARRGCQGAEDRLPCLLELFGSVVRSIQLQLPANTGEIAAVAAQQVLDDPLQVAAAAARPLAKLLACRRLHRLVERAPAGLQQRLKTLKFGVVDRPRIA